MAMSEQAKKARRDYYRKYREEHRDHIREYTREWRKNNPDKVAANYARYWERIAQLTKDKAEE